MVPLSKVQDLIAKHSKLEKELSSQQIDKKSFAEKSKEYSDLSDIIKEAISYFNFQKNKDELENLINDNDMDKEMKQVVKFLQGLFILSLFILTEVSVGKDRRQMLLYYRHLETDLIVIELGKP